MHMGVLSILTKRALNEKGNGALQCAYMIVILMVDIAKLRTESFLNCTHKDAERTNCHVAHVTYSVQNTILCV